MSIRKAVKSAVALLFTSSLATLVVMPAEADTFLRLAGIEGSSDDKAHKGEIDVTGYTQIISEGAKCARLVITKPLDNASPALAALAVSNQPIADGRVVIAKPGDSQLETFRADLTQIDIESMELVDQGKGNVVEKVILLPRTLSLSFTPQRPDGSAGTPITGVVTCP